MNIKYWKRYRSSILTLIFFLIMQSAVADDNESFFRSTNNAIPRSPLITSLPTPEQTPNNYPEQDDIWNVIRQHFSLQDQYQRPEVYKWIYWLKSNPSILNRIFRNAAPYIYYVFQQTQNYQMPAEFTLLPIIESAYDPYAYSSTGAVGIWQMMPGTAMIYGLDISWWYDGRRDILTSTDRALSYLVSLHKTLGNWLLAAAAYDAGAVTIQRAIVNNPEGYQGSSFWRLSLAQETEDYVPKLLAVAAIVADPQKYGVTLPYIPNKAYFSATQLNFQIDMDEISELSQLPASEIKKLNPGMQRFATDPNQGFTLLLPVANMAIFHNNLTQVAGKNHVTWQYHEVHSGQTLESIAENYHTTLDILRKANLLKIDNEVTPGEGLIVPLYLHRKFALPVNNANENTAQVNNTNEEEAKSSSTVQNITAEQVLSGNLSSINRQDPSGQQNSTNLDEQNTNNNPSNSDLTNNDSNLTNNMASNFENENQVPTQNITPTSDNTLSQGTTQAQTQTPSEPIKEQDNLQTIMNKLYPISPNP